MKKQNITLQDLNDFAAGKGLDPTEIRIGFYDSNGEDGYMGKGIVLERQKDQWCYTANGGFYDVLDDGPVLVVTDGYHYEPEDYPDEALKEDLMFGTNYYGGNPNLEQREPDDYDDDEEK